MKQSLLTIIPLLVLATTLNVYAGGPRTDYPSDATEEGAYCWVDGYDAGFAGKYDKDRAIECVILADDEYNSAWKVSCKDAEYMPNECQYFKNHPEDLEHAGLYEENRRHCYDVGYADGKNSTLFNKKEDGACSEFSDSYESGSHPCHFEFSFLQLYHTPKTLRVRKLHNIFVHWIHKRIQRLEEYQLLSACLC
jgi:hypothetical protein